MDLLKQIKDKVTSNPDWSGARGLQSVLTHIEIAERYHHRAKADRDEHLYTDVIYRTNHAFEGILKEAYVVLAEKPADKLTPHEIEEYLLSSKALRGMVIDLLKNYRQHWRNPSTHDYQLFFSEQESYLAIVTVSAFVSILLDQMLEKVAYVAKFRELENEAFLARDRIEDFAELPPVEKVWRVIESYASHYLKNFAAMSLYSRSTANAQLAAFIAKVAPELSVEQEVVVANTDQEFIFDLVVADNATRVVVETREPRSRDVTEAHVISDAAISQLAARLRAAGLNCGVIFFYPGAPDEIPIATTSSTAWPKDLSLREVYGADPSEFPDDEHEKPVSLVEE